MAIGDDGVREHGVRDVLGFVLADMEGAALVATHGVRAMELLPVEGDKQTAVEAQQGVEIAVAKDSTEAEWNMSAKKEWAQPSSGFRIWLYQNVANSIVAAECLPRTPVGVEDQCEQASRIKNLRALRSCRSASPKERVPHSRKMTAGQLHVLRWQEKRLAGRCRTQCGLNLPTAHDKDGR